MNDHALKPIGVLRGPFKEKMGIPRQAGLNLHAKGEIHFFSPYDRTEAFVGLEEFTHLWVTFIFHEANSEHLSVRPPRLGGNKKLGVFATRSPYRPNNLGLSCVKLEQVVTLEGKVKLEVSGFDLLDETPIVDIKPYIPAYDSIEKSSGGWTQDLEPITNLKKVRFEQKVKDILEQMSLGHLEDLIRSSLEHNPFPAYHEPGRKYGFKLDCFDVQVHNLEDEVVVFDLIKL